MAKHKHSMYLVVLVTLMLLFGLVVVLDGCNTVVTDSVVDTNEDGGEDVTAEEGEEVVTEDGDLAGMAIRRKAATPPTMKAPDLRIKSVYIQSVDSFFRIRAKIKNFGNSDITKPFELKLTTLNDNGDEYEYNSHTVPSINAGETKLINIIQEYDYNLLNNKGVLPFKVEVDSLNQVFESSETNNVYKKKLVADHELRLLDVDLKIVSKEKNLINAIIEFKNVGIKDITHPFHIKIACIESGVLSYTNTDVEGSLILVDSIKSGEKKIINEDITYLPECNHESYIEFAVFLDPDNILNELSRSNNQKYESASFY